MIIMEDLLGTINNDEWVTIELRDEETNALLDRRYDLTYLLLTTGEIEDIRYAHVDEIKVDNEGEIVISILFDTEE